MLDTHYIAELLKKKLSGALSASEEAELMRWAGSDAVYQDLLAQIEEGKSIEELVLLRYELEQGDEQDFTDKLRKNVGSRISETDPSSKPYSIRRMLPYAAAAVLLVAGTVSWMMLRDDVISVENTVYTEMVNDIAPGGNRAMLKLADGRVITLDEIQRGIVVDDDEILYDDGTSLLSLSPSDADVERLAVPLLELSTPMGGTYYVELPDGTQVWLNAATTLRYPAKFGLTERIVEVEGEAYFQVSHDANRPFKVNSSGQLIEVLGTEFNVTAYPDEAGVKTTLVEGRVKIQAAPEQGASASTDFITLVPGEQSFVDNGNLVKSLVDVSAVTAWKSGKFHFDGKSFQQVMNEVSRWYDLDIVYPGGVPSGQLVGDAYRSQNLSVVLKMLDVLEVNYELSVADKKLTIYDKKGGKP
ncbi:FecR family protein [Parapedobacter soli]|uniref:FecR family protein n=1 Tax=Parapedobacter soli TaxID=416955 RepID=UPI0021C64C25|nr:FecR domain-containing protein [Parapedobacter soli]